MPNAQAKTKAREEGARSKLKNILRAAAVDESHIWKEGARFCKHGGTTMRRSQSYA